jgi:hypothetical protein
MPLHNTPGVFGTSPNQVSGANRLRDSYKPITAAGPNESAYQNYLDNLSAIRPELFGKGPLQPQQQPQGSGSTSDMEFRLQQQQLQQQPQLQPQQRQRQNSKAYETYLRERQRLEQGDQTRGARPVPVQSLDALDSFLLSLGEKLATPQGSGSTSDMEFEAYRQANLRPMGSGSTSDMEFEAYRQAVSDNPYFQ